MKRTVCSSVALGLAALVSFALDGTAVAKDLVKVAFIGPLTGGVSANGLGGRNSADLAIRLRNADANAKYEYEMVALDDECKPNIGVQVATKAAADSRRRRRRHPLLLGGGDRHGRHLPPLRAAGDRLGRGAARHHLWQRLSGDPPRQRHHDQSEPGQRRVHDRSRLRDLGDHPRHHRLRPGPQRVLQPVPYRERRRDPRDLRRDRGAAGLHRRADPGEVARTPT